MIACSAICPLSLLNVGAIALIPSNILSNGRCTPITPVEHTNTSSDLRFNSLAVQSAKALASSNPFFPVAALAFPLFTTTARIFPFFNTSLQ